MKKIVLMVLVCLLLLGSVPVAQSATAFFARWIHFSKYTSTYTLTAPYVIMRRDAAVWDASVSNWTTADSTYTNLDLRPVWNANSNIWVLSVPQSANLTAGPATLTLYDAADGAEAITDVAKWGAMIEVEVRQDGSIRFIRLPEAY
jgi:hypothetical protein